MTYLIAGCGYTGERVALALRTRGDTVIATTRERDRADRLAAAGVDVRHMELPGGSLGPLPSNLRVLHSVPALEREGVLIDPTPEILKLLSVPIDRLVYLSTTSVYGRTPIVDERTPAHATNPRERVRLTAEETVKAFGTSWCVLRPAAIYGPDRGFHISLLRGTARITGDGSTYISRIHVDDLAALTLAALDSDVSGCWPVADDEPSTQLEIAEFCCSRLGLPLPASIWDDQAHATRRGNRRVDGSALRNLLGVKLLYPTFREGLTPVLDRIVQLGRA